MPASAPEVLTQLFSESRDEFRRDLFGETFVRPPYFTKLEATRNCVLSGGRGTGKTTVLRSLSFAAVSPQGSEKEPPFLAFYLKINKNHMHTFRGASLTEDEWRVCFAHYFNLLVCFEMSQFIDWLTSKKGWHPFSAQDTSRFLDNFGVAPTPGEPLTVILRQLLIRLELYVNNPRRVERPTMSMPERPVRDLATMLHLRAEATGRPVFCCIDEFENLTPEQQVLVNTYIKQADRVLLYKIGVRSKGQKTHRTIDSEDQLSYPADYDLIDITEEVTPSFMTEVVEKRLELASQAHTRIPTKFRDFLCDLTRAEEAVQQGAAKTARDVQKALNVEEKVSKWVEKLGVDAYLVRYCSLVTKSDDISVARLWMDNPQTMATWVGNYGYSSIFWLSMGRKGASLRKHYCGAETFILLASGNLRYLLELVGESISRQFQISSHEENKGDWITIEPKPQTEAAIEVGRRRLEYLDSYSRTSREVRYMVLGIGAIFSELARSPLGSAPEQNMFVVTGSEQELADVQSLLAEGVSLLALERMPKTKATAPAQRSEDEYRLHPIFAPFFYFSHRRKRSINLEANTLLAFTQGNSNRAVGSVLASSHRAGKTLEGAEKSEAAWLENMPPQLSLFSNFFEESL